MCRNECAGNKVKNIKQLIMHNLIIIPMRLPRDTVACSNRNLSSMEAWTENDYWSFQPLGYKKEQIHNQFIDTIHHMGTIIIPCKCMLINAYCINT